MSTAAPLYASAPAKLNLTLDILGIRTDGYHEIRGVFQTISLADTIAVQPLAEPQVRLWCSDPALNTPHNTCLRIAALIRRRYAVSSGVLIRLYKRIPHGSGLGGASSDAYTTARLLRELWRLPMPARELLDIGAAVGADVPFFHTGGCCVVGGIGERVQPIPVPWDARPFTVLIAMPSTALSTPQVYAAFDRLHPGHAAARACHTDRLLAWCHRMPADGRPPLGNALWDAARSLLPVLAGMPRALATAGARPASMTGSGSAVFGICSDDTHARRCAARLRNAHPGLRLFIARTLSRRALRPSVGRSRS